ncbi:hypothetical protein HK102_003728 [Quaeritorhiza haematococci]|nr:hypothetical protein HK102_003728 [Quaeritorhiza haematococci]
MRAHTIIAFLAAASAAFALPQLDSDERQSVTCPPPGFNSAPALNLEAFLGQWFVQSQLPTFYLPRGSNFCVYANYTKTSDTSISIFNYANRGGVNQNAFSTNPRLRGVIKNTAEPAKLSVGPSFLPSFFYGPYWVIETGDISPTTGLYEWALISGGQPRRKTDAGKCIANPRFNFFGNGQGLWIFTREQIAPKALVDSIKERATGLGLDVSLLDDVVQEGCLYQ